MLRLAAGFTSRWKTVPPTASTSVVEARLRRVTRVNLRWSALGLAFALACVLPVSAAAQTAEERATRQAVDELVPQIRSAAAIIYNPQTGDVLWENNSHDQRSIASLTKIMTAVTFVSDEPDLDRVVVVQRADVTRASVTYLRAGERVTLRNLLHLTLIASDNAAARVLARVSPGGTAAFIERMNETALAMGLTNTHYADPSGLDARNVSTAYDLSHLIAYATSHPTLGPIMRLRETTVRSGTRSFRIRNTNRLLGTDVDVVGGKTGFISKAGYCLATLLQVPQGSQVAVVVLGAANSALRFAEARNLFNWAVVRTTGLLTGVPPVDLSSRD
jgi:D-alanyl-D-alanine endopeptidase (penicillin-binding protein 7)